MKVRKHFPLDENLARPKGTRPVEEVEIWGSIEESQQLFHDLNRILSLVEHLASRRKVPGLDKPDDDSYRRLHALLESLQPIVG